MLLEFYVSPVNLDINFKHGEFVEKNVADLIIFFQMKYERKIKTKSYYSSRSLF